MPKMIEYTDTAYTYAQKKALLPAVPVAWTGMQKRFRKCPLPGGVHCGDFRLLLSEAFLEGMKSGKLRNGDLEQVRISFIDNPLVYMYILRFMAGFLASCSFVLFILFSFSIKSFDGIFFVFFLITGGAWLIFHYLTKIVPDKNNITLNRATGMICFPLRKKAPAREMPFAEFDGYYHTTTSPVGVVRYQLCLGHRYSPTSVMHGGGVDTDIESIYALWEKLQQLMDINLPLPDLPEFEPFRQQDPTTKAWDEKHGRDPDYWKKMNPDWLPDLRREGYEALKAVDWSLLPRDHVPSAEAIEEARRTARRR